MAEYHLGRSEYRFDPTAAEAVARADRETLHIPPADDPYHTSQADLGKLTNAVFEPPKLITNRQLGRARYKRRIAESKQRKEGI